MVGEDMPIGDLRYVVILYDKHGLSAAMTKEGHVFIIAILFRKEAAARSYVNTVKNFLNKEGILFKRVEEEEVRRI